jgi:hypothetical protein
MTTRPSSPKCIKFHQNPTVDPITKFPIKPTSYTYKMLVKECGAPPAAAANTPIFSPTQVKPQAGTQLPQPVIQMPRQGTVFPQPVTQLPQPVAQMPRQGTVFPQPVTQFPQPVIQMPRQGTVFPQPVTQMPRQGTVFPQPVTQMPRTGTVFPQPVTQMPRTGTVFPQPVIQMPRQGTVFVQPPRTPSPTRIPSPPRTPIPDRITRGITTSPSPSPPFRQPSPRARDENITFRSRNLRNIDITPGQNLDADGYINQPVPNPEDFAFNATPENSEYIQAAIATARDLYPSFDLIIQAAQSSDMFRETGENFKLARRDLYPSYFKDASTFEIFKIYKEDRALAARALIHEVFFFHFENYHNELTDFMEQHGYHDTYGGYVNVNHPAGRISMGDTPLTPETFRNSITPDMAILMEEMRKRALTDIRLTDFGSVHGIGPLLNLKDLREQIVQNGYESNAEVPFLKRGGFNRKDLRDEILRIETRLFGPRARKPRFTRQYVQNQGETAVSEDGRDLTNRMLTLGRRMPKAYYYMLYNELINRNLA